MKDVDMLKDILQNKIDNQVQYNNYLINIRNPELKQLYTQLRDDETRTIVQLQQMIQKLEAPPGLISKIFSNNPDY